MHEEMRSVGFLIEPQNQGLRFVSGLASKPVATVFSSLALKPVATISPSLASKPVVMVSPCLASKLVAWVSRFGPQNRQLWFGYLASKSPRRFFCLGLKIKRGTVCQLRHKTDGRMESARGTRQNIVVA
jgi:hypothetical protein